MCATNTIIWITSCTFMGNVYNSGQFYDPMITIIILSQFNTTVSIVNCKIRLKIYYLLKYLRSLHVKFQLQHPVFSQVTLLLQESRLLKIKVN